MTLYEPQEIGRVLAACRVAANLTQEELGQQAKISKSQIARYERGEESASTKFLNQLLRALGVTAQEFYMFLELYQRARERREGTRPFVTPAPETRAPEVLPEDDPIKEAAAMIAKAIHQLHAAPPPTPRGPSDPRRRRLPPPAVRGAKPRDEFGA